MKRKQTLFKKYLPIPICIAAICTQITGHAEVIGLLCSASVNGRPAFVQVIKVDFDSKKVNGANAWFTDTEIKWVTPGDDGHPVVNTLNRIAGTFRSVSRNPHSYGVPPLYACEKAPPAKF